MKTTRILARTPQNFYLLRGITGFFGELKTPQPIIYIYLSGYIFLITAYKSSSILLIQEDTSDVISVMRLLLVSGLF